MLRLEAFQQVVPSYFDQIPGDLVDAADLPEHARGLRWKVAVVQGDHRVLVNSYGDVGVEVPVDDGTDLFRLDSDPDGLARKIGFASLNDLNDALSDVLGAAINAARTDRFRDQLSEAEAHAFDELIGPREDMPDVLTQDALEAGVKWIEFIANQDRTLTDEDVDSVLDVIERFEMRQVDGVETLYQTVAAIAAGANVTDESAGRMLDWLGRRDAVEAQLGASTRDYIAGVNQSVARRPSAGRRLLDRLNKVLGQAEAEQKPLRRKGPRI